MGVFRLLHLLAGLVRLHSQCHRIRHEGSMKTQLEFLFVNRSDSLLKVVLLLGINRNTHTMKDSNIGKQDLK